jgi:hypothetical protein
MSYTLAAAAAACGVNKSTVLRAIKGGKISGTKDEHGEWHVEPAELHRVYPPVAAAAAGTDATQRDAMGGCNGARNGEPAGRPGRRTAGRVEGHARGHAMRPRCVARSSTAPRPAEAGARAASTVDVALAAHDRVTADVGAIGKVKAPR